jgi:hypothetical protein
MTFESASTRNQSQAQQTATATARKHKFVISKHPSSDGLKGVDEARARLSNRNCLYTIEFQTQQRRMIQKCRQKLLEDNSARFLVRRSLSDFESLRTRLRVLFKGCVVPVLSAIDDFDGRSDEREIANELERFLRRCFESPLIQNSRTMEIFLIEQDEQRFRTVMDSDWIKNRNRSVVGGGSGENEEEDEESWWNLLEEDDDVRAVKAEQERKNSFWGSLFSGGGVNRARNNNNNNNNNNIAERKFSRTKESVLKDEDPAYLQVITYASKLDEQCDAFVRCAKMYVEQLESRLNATNLSDLGKAALKMGQSEEQWGKPLQKRSKNFSLGYTLHALSDCANSMTFSETASELKACDAVRVLIPYFEDCRQRVEAIRETFEDRTTALLYYQIACDVYDEVIEKHGRAVANVHSECLEADKKRETRRRAYDLIVERTRDEYPRWHASIGDDMTKSLRAFAKTRAALCRRDAECWEMMLRDPTSSTTTVTSGGGVRVDSDLGDKDVKYDQLRNHKTTEVLSTKEKILLEKNARKQERLEKRREKEERELLKAWKREAKSAIANGLDVPEMPDFKKQALEKISSLSSDKKKKKKKKEDYDDDDDEDENEDENILRRQTRGGSAASISSSVTTTKTNSSSLFNQADDNEEIFEKEQKPLPVVRKQQQQQQQQRRREETSIASARPAPEALISRPPPEPLAKVKVDEASISEQLAAVKMEDDDSDWSD